MIREDIVLILTVLRIDKEVESAVGVLQFGDEVRFPFGFLHHVADAVAAFGDAQIVERGDAWQ